jgi:RNA polymerase sigma-70 factor, ECF subfamily
MPDLTVRSVLSSTAETRSDEELLAAHVAGDRWAFQELFGRYHRQLHRLAIRHSRSPEDAADALQEAMLAAHRGAPAFRRHSAVSTWLHRIVVNKCLDQLRCHWDHRALIPELHPVTDATGQLDTQIVVHRALAALPPDRRAAVIAVDLHGHSIAAAAVLLGVAEGTVKSRRSRGRAQLALLLAGLHPPAAA